MQPGTRWTALVALHLLTDLEPRRKLKAVDFFGVFLALGGTTVLMLGLTWGGGEHPWESAHTIATLVVGFVVCAAFMLWQWKGPRYPLVPRESGPLGPFIAKQPLYLGQRICF